MMIYGVQDLRRMLKEHGYDWARTRGSHEIWKSERKTISLPRTKLDKRTAARIAKNILQ